MIDPRGTWRGKPDTKPTDRECYESCIENAHQAARDERQARDMVLRLQPGDALQIQAKLDVQRHAADQPHWRGMAEFYLRRVNAAPPDPDRRLPREPGDDDIDETEVEF